MIFTIGRSCYSIAITGNIIFGNSNDGILIYHADTGIVITGNSITSNGSWGIEIYYGGNAVIIVANNLVGNTSGSISGGDGDTIVNHNLT